MAELDLKRELLVVSVGVSDGGSRAASIGAIEDAMERAFPDYAVRRAFSSSAIIAHILRRDGETVDGVKKALDRARAGGVRELLVQPTYLMGGYAYGALAEELEKRAGDFESIRLGAPLLKSEEDFAIVAETMVRAVPAGGRTAVCYMGHGTGTGANAVYGRMQRVLADAGHGSYFIGTMKSAPTAEDLVALVREGGYERVILRPMMIAAGSHARKDMADGKDPGSWRSVFTAAGFEVVCEVKGLGELEEVRRLLVSHAREARGLGSGLGG